MGTEAAIIQLVMQGVPEFEGARDKIALDLTSVESAGGRARAASESAENAAKRAEDASEAMSRSITSALGRLSRASSFVETIAGALGESDNEGIDAARGALRGASQGARIGALLGPEGALIGGGIGALVGAVESLQKSSEKEAKRQERLDEIEGRQRSREVEDALLRSIGLSKADVIAGGGGRHL